MFAGQNFYIWRFSNLSVRNWNKTSISPLYAFSVGPKASVLPRKMRRRRRIRTRPFRTLILGFLCFFILTRHEQQVAALQKKLIFPVKIETFWIKPLNCLKQLISATFCPNPSFCVEMFEYEVPIEVPLLCFRHCRPLLHLRFRQKVLATYSSAPPIYYYPLPSCNCHDLHVWAFATPSVVLQDEKVHENTMVSAPPGPGNLWYKSSKDVKDWSLTQI